MGSEDTTLGTEDEVDHAELAVEERQATGDRRQVILSDVVYAAVGRMFSKNTEILTSYDVKTEIFGSPLEVYS